MSTQVQPAPERTSDDLPEPFHAKPRLKPPPAQEENSAVSRNGRKGSPAKTLDEGVKEGNGRGWVPEERCEEYPHPVPLVRWLCHASKKARMNVAKP